MNPKEEKAQRKRKELEIKVQQLQEQRKDEVLKGLKDLGNTILGKFGMSLDNFKMQQNENGSYNIQFKQWISNLLFHLIFNPFFSSFSKCPARLEALKALVARLASPVAQMQQRSFPG